MDGSARVQTVSGRDDAEFRALLEAVGRHAGRQMVLNASFNVKGEPIVNTPTEAIETFLGTTSRRCSSRIFWCASAEGRRFDLFQQPQQHRNVPK